MKKRVCLLLAAFVLLFTGCMQGQASSETLLHESSTFSESSIAEPSSLPEDPSKTESSSSPSETESVTSSEMQDSSDIQTVTLYIGMNGNFVGYSVDFDGDRATLTPDFLIESIAELTGWDLTLADAVSTGKGGMTVCFSSQCSLFTGPPQPQKEDFFVYDSYQLAQTILDSIKYTLQYNFVDPILGDPSSLSIYYCMEDNEPLTLDALNITFPIDEPYEGFPQG